MATNADICEILKKKTTTTASDTKQSIVKMRNYCFYVKLYIYTVKWHHSALGKETLLSYF